MGIERKSFGNEAASTVKKVLFKSGEGAAYEKYSGNTDKTRRALDEDMTRKGLQAWGMFQAANDAKDLAAALRYWDSVKGEMLEAEETLSCNEARESQQYKALAEDVIGTVWECYPELVVAIFSLVFDHADGNAKAEIDDLKEIFKQINDEFGPDLAIKGVGTAVRKSAHKLLKPETIRKATKALRKLFEALWKKKKGQLFKLLGAILACLKGLSAELIAVGKLIATPMMIAPEMCGIVQSVNKAQQEAIMRVYGDRTKSLPPSPSMALRGRT